MIVYTYYKNFQDLIDTIEVDVKRIDSVNYVVRWRSPGEINWDFDIKLILNDSTIVIPEGNWNTTGNIYKCIDRRAYKLYYNGDRYYFVYRILHYSSAIDAEGLTFWSPEFGVILGKSLAWGSFVRFEYLNDESKNSIIQHLCYSIMNDKEFYNLSDWEEKYKFK